MKISYSWLKSYVPELPDAEKLCDVFTYHLCEVESLETLPEGEKIFDLNILPNRAHDLLSHQGIARELAGQLGLKFHDATPMYKIPESLPTKLQIESQTDNCRRYTGRIVRNITVGPSPEWVVKYLESIGQRSINNIVDATNIVMYDCGQPCHAFDIRKIPGEKIIIKNAKDGEELELLGSEKIKAKLKNSDTVIANADDMTLGIAGVKGGLHSGVQNDTTEIVLEVANFDPVAVRKTARRLGILTDSAKRFENDLSPTLCDFAMMELSALIVEMCPNAQFETIVNFEQKPPENLRKITFKTAQINNMLGSNISDGEVVAILQKYAFNYTQNGDVFELEIPAMRLDLWSINDVAEEIGRIIGYDTLAPVIPKIDFDKKVNEKHEKIMRARNVLLAHGYSEVMTYSFAKSGVIEVAYGTSGEKFLRTNLSDGIKKSYELNRLNAHLLGCDEIKIFEIGNIFLEKNVEHTHIAIADKKGVKEFSVENFAEKISDENNLSQILLIEKITDTKIFIQNFNKKHFSKKEIFSAWSPFPFITRDISVWVPEHTDPEILLQIFVEHGGELLARTPQLFDMFSKENKTSFGFRLVFQSQNKTLTDEETYTIVDNINNTLKNKGYIVR
ncbi:MAG: phenylalanine--tRNA ligase subunit beta [bacterium]